MFKMIKEKIIYKYIFFYLLFIILNERINCNNNTCFEYSCEECNSTEYGQCTKCRYGWTLVDGTCPCFNTSCAICTTGLGGLDICKLCKNGYILENDYCICNISNCEQCGENKCLVCDIGYIYNNTSNKCEKQNNENIICYDNNCSICFSELKGACIECKEGFDVRKGECIELIHTKENGKCPIDYYQSENYCFPNCDGVDCPIERSNSRNLCPSNRCLFCRNNILYILAECDNSVECSSIEGCINCLTNDECIFCNQGYYLLGGLCYKCIKGCGICRNNKTCDYCLSGFELTSDNHCKLTNNFDFNITLYNYYKEELLKQNCSYDTCLSCYFNSEKCEKCKSGYYSYRGRCLPCSSNCLDCQNYNYQQFCWKCENGYKVNNRGECELICIDENCLDCFLFRGRQICEKCKSGHVKDGLYSNCLLCSNLCKECYYIYGTEYCSECYEGYYLKNKTCIKCSDENCLNCHMNNEEEERCTYCKSGYEINGKNCSLCTLENCLNCYFYEGKEKCLRCEYGYINNGKGECFKLVFQDEKCNSYKFINGTAICYGCNNGYELINGICSLICLVSNCLNCFYKNSCSQCKNGYKLEYNKCVKCIDSNCNKCDDYKYICTECNDETILYDGDCVFNSSYCQQININYCKYCIHSECLMCSEGYKKHYYDGNCHKKKDKTTTTLIVIFSIFGSIALIVIICIIKKRKEGQANEIRINQNNINNINNNAYIYSRHHHSININSSENIISEKDLSDEFYRQKMKLEKDKICQICKKNIGKYIGDCGCIVCQEHSNFKIIKKDEEEQIIDTDNYTNEIAFLDLETGEEKRRTERFYTAVDEIAYLVIRTAKSRNTPDRDSDPERVKDMEEKDVNKKSVVTLKDLRWENKE